MHAHLTKGLTLEEIFKAIHALPKGKVLGHDGVPMEFFQECAYEIAPTLLKAFTTILDTGEASASINKGQITLIPKSGNHSKFDNWRQITLLGSVYKILAKTLAGRIQASLPLIIRPNQTGFVEGRSILDNTYIAQESLDWAVENNQDLVLLLLDFEKTFDRTEWGFLFTALSKLGFNGRWIKWVCTLYHEVTSTIKINGEVGPDFQLTHSVRQGCPLAPYLFILAIDVLGHMLDDPRHGVEGMSLPRGGCIKDQTFVDNTTLYLKGVQPNMDKAQNVLKLFCKASGAKINWNKSTTI
jgi:mannosylglycoprotein endo-beta-mannosidase